MLLLPRISFLYLLFSTFLYFYVLGVSLNITFLDFVLNPVWGYLTLNYLIWKLRLLLRKTLSQYLSSKIVSVSFSAFYLSETPIRQTFSLYIVSLNLSFIFCSFLCRLFWKILVHSLAASNFLLNSFIELLIPIYISIFRGSI